MVKVSKKAMSFFCVVLAILIASTTIVSNLMIGKTNNIQDTTKNVLNRDNYYHHYSLTNMLQNNFKLNNFVQTVAKDNFYTYIINEERFINNFKEIIRNSLKNISVFSSNYLSYIIKCNYKIIGDTKINVDLVWYLPSSKTKYYDQFSIELQNN